MMQQCFTAKVLDSLQAQHRAIAGVCACACAPSS